MPATPTSSATPWNGLVAGGHNHAVAVTEISAGTAMIAFDLSPSPLDADDSLQWEHSAGFDHTSTTGVTHLAVGMGPDEEADDVEAYEIGLAFDGPGGYRMRLHARGRELCPDGVRDEDEPVAEHSLPQVWPAGGGAAPPAL
ncbi:hypothetical protein ACWD5B_06025 [Streptomyces tanashiensis]